jgi:hypothetical protein
MSQEQQLKQFTVQPSQLILESMTYPWLGTCLLETQSCLFIHIMQILQLQQQLKLLTSQGHQDQMEL